MLSVHVRGRGYEQDVAGHPQVHHHVHLVLEPPVEVLPAPAEALDPTALDGGRQLLRGRRLAPARVEDLEPLDPAALDLRREEAPDRLYLGKLGHCN